jgi:hypothetical protein
MTPTERRVLAEMTALARRQLTRTDHLATVIQTESRGACHWGKPCRPDCVTARRQIAAAEKLLAETAPLQIVQMQMEAS